MDGWLSRNNSIPVTLYSLYLYAFKLNTSIFKEKYRGLSDILNGVSKGQIKFGYGHRNAYWNNRTIQDEAIVNMVE